MPVEVSYRDDGGVVLTGQGRLSGEELIEINNAIYASDERIRAISYQLCDFTSVNDFGVTSAEVQYLVVQDSEASKINPGMLIAVVAEQDVAYGMARIWASYNDDPSLGKAVFRELAEAEAWLEDQLRSRP